MPRPIDPKSVDRRSLIGAAALAAAAPAWAANGAADETFWTRIADQFDADRSIIQLENGNFGMMPRPVAAAYERHLARVNHQTSYYSRRLFERDAARIRARAAAALGAAPEEIAFTRNATEALQALIGGYNRLRPGDLVLAADLDYDSMLVAMRWLKTRRGADLVRINLPEGDVTRQTLIDVYEKALIANPRVRMMLLTHVSHRTGLVLPVAEIVAMARSRGVDVIVDGAHALGQTPEKPCDLGFDFAGFNGHKWIGAPLGVGVLYIRKGRTHDIDPFMGNDEYPDPEDVRNRVHTGTTSFATLLALEDALDFHEMVGPARKAARLKALRDQWAEPARALPGVEILTPKDPALSAAITAFRLRGVTGAAENAALARRLLDEFGVFTVHRTGVARGACIRVTPALFTRPSEIEALSAALRKIATA